MRGEVFPIEILFYFLEERAISMSCNRDEAAARVVKGEERFVVLEFSRVVFKS